MTRPIQPDPSHQTNQSQIMTQPLMTRFKVAQLLTQWVKPFHQTLLVRTNHE